MRRPARWDALAKHPVRRDTPPTTIDRGCARGSIPCKADRDPTRRLERSGRPHRRQAQAQARRLLAEDPRAAATQARAALVQAPGDVQARLLLGAALRRCDRFDEAVAVLQALAVVQPEAWGVQFETGVALAALGRTQQAIAALAKASRLNPRSSLARHALGDQLASSGDMRGAEAACAARLSGSTHDTVLIETVRAMFDGEVDAEARLGARFGLHFTDLAAVRLLADVGLQLGRPENVEAMLAPWRVRAPRFVPMRHSLARALQLQSRLQAALDEVDHGLALAPADLALQSLRAALLVEASAYEAASHAYETLVHDMPAEPRLWLSYGHVLKTLGRQPASVAAYRRALEIAPTLGEAYWSLANLKVVPFAPEEVAAMRILLERNDLEPQDRTALHYALGKALEDEGAFARAFDHYQAGAALRRATVTYAAAAHRRFVDRVRAVFTREALDRRSGWGDPSPEPIFVVGLPRSGSTLVEQILSSHSQIEGLSELPVLTALARECARARSAVDYPELLLELDAADLQRTGRTYLERTRIHRKLDLPLFVDKFPGNVLHLGLIHLCLPNARVIDVRRQPMSCCLSLYKQLFANGQAYSYDLGELGSHYSDYVSLVDHFSEVAPDWVLRVDYESLVSDPEFQIRRMLAHCHLDFEDACLDFHMQERPVRTASSEQVRRPLTTNAIEHWRHFEAQLAPLRAALAPHLRTGVG